jgi:hypothetical protein
MSGPDQLDMRSRSAVYPGAAGLMAANLVGFVVGLDGLKPLLADMATRPAFAVATFAVFFSAAQVCSAAAQSLHLCELHRRGAAWFKGRWQAGLHTPCYFWCVVPHGGISCLAEALKPRNLAPLC